MSTVGDLRDQASQLKLLGYTNEEIVRLFNLMMYLSEGAPKRAEIINGEVVVNGCIPC